MKSVFPYMLLYLFGVFLSSISQIMLKKEAMKEHKNFIAEYLNVRVIVGYMIFFGCTFLNILAYKGMPMNYGPVLETAGYIFVTVLGMTLLKEKITGKKAMAMLVIVAGILLYAI